MNREIKFKAKRVDNGECVYGYYLFHRKESFIIPIDKTIRRFKVIPETVCQFTGLRDKNGIEIYEGDVLSFEEGSFKDFTTEDSYVMYDDGSFCVEVIYDLHLIPLCQQDCVDSIVTGNKHD